jgi:hypothetical protein
MAEWRRVGSARRAGLRAFLIELEPLGPMTASMSDRAAASSGNTRYCLGCSHSLRGVTEPVCPECGRDFDPHDPRTTGESPFPVRRALGRLTRGLALFGIAVLLVAILCSAAGWREWMWLFAFAMSPILLLGAVMAMIPPIMLSRRWRMACIAVPLIVASVVLTDWPFRLVFELHRARFDAAVAEIRAAEGRLPAGRMQIGGYQILAVKSKSEGSLGFQLTGGRGGGVFLVHLAPTGSLRGWNTNWELDLGGEWWMIYED